MGAVAPLRIAQRIIVHDGFHVVMSDERAKEKESEMSNEVSENQTREDHHTGMFQIGLAI